MKTLVLVLFALAVAEPALSTGVTEDPPVFLLQWGGYGSNPGHFDHPYGMTFDDTDVLYVADALNNRIQKFTVQGIYVGEFGTFGFSPGQLYTPSDVAIGPDGNVYVVEHSNSRVQVFTPDGAFLRGWGSRGSAIGQFDLPDGIAVDGAGNVYVSDSANGRIQKFMSDGTFITQWGTFDAYWEPEGIVLDQAGHVFVADAVGGGRIHKFTSDGVYLIHWTFEPGGAPRYLAVDAHGDVYATDYLDDYVLKFSPDGKLLTRWGGAGSKPGQFAGPTGIALDSSHNIFVAESYFLQYGHRIQKFGDSTVPIRRESLGHLKQAYH